MEKHLNDSKLQSLYNYKTEGEYLFIQGGGKFSIIGQLMHIEIVLKILTLFWLNY